MFLIAETLAPYLIGRGTLQAGDVVDGDFTLAAASRRNRNFKVYQSGRPGLFVKQVPMAHPEVIGTLRQEAVFLRFAKENACFAAMRGFVPELRDYDPNRHTLTTTLVPGARDLGEMLRASSSQPQGPGTAGAVAPSMMPADFRPDLAAELGRMVAAYHAASSALLADTAVADSFPWQPPWAITVAQRVQAGQMSSSRMSPALMPILEQMHDLIRHGAEVSAQWRPSCLIHGDLKWDNVLVVAPPDGEPATLTLIDWELASVGEPAWDIACVFYGYAMWAFLVIGGIGGPPTAPGSLSAESLTRVQTALRAFWNAYCEGVPLAAGPDRWALLLRSVRLMAFRCVQGAMELSANDTQVSPATRAVLQAARNLLATPELALAELLGPDPV